MQEQEKHERTLNEETTTPSEQCRSSNDEAEAKNEEMVEREKNTECDGEVVNNNESKGI